MTMAIFFVGGLRNVGNTCFINCVGAVLIHGIPAVSSDTGMFSGVKLAVDIY